MRIDGRHYDEDEWRIVRVDKASETGRLHAKSSGHGGSSRGDAWACEDCKTVYYDSSCIAMDDVEVQVDGAFMARLVDLAVAYGRDLPALQGFIHEVGRRYVPGYAAPDLVLKRAMEGDDDAR